MGLNGLIREITAASNRRRRQRERDLLFSWNLDPDDITEWFEFEALEFDDEINKLFFIIKKYTRKPKITRYVTQNYVRTPIYEEYREQSKIVMKFNKTININKFLNEDILKLDIEHDLILDVIDIIGFIPHWRYQEIEIDKINLKISSLSGGIRFFINEKKNYILEKVNHEEKASNFWLRLFFAPFTLGISFIGFLSKPRAKYNACINAKNKKINSKHIIEIDEININIHKEIRQHNLKIKDKISKLLDQIEIVELEQYESIPEEDGWVMIKEASAYGFDDLKGLKGIYIIKNLTKNIYYVGQSKDIGRRLTQHFKNGKVNNIKFAEDWYAGDVFGFKHNVLQTKDELDSEEKRLIELYDSFTNGYNATGGNQ